MKWSTDVRTNAMLSDLIINLIKYMSCLEGL